MLAVLVMLAVVLSKGGGFSFSGMQSATISTTGTKMGNRIQEQEPLEMD